MRERSSTAELLSPPELCQLSAFLLSTFVPESGKNKRITRRLRVRCGEFLPGSGCVMHEPKRNGSWVLNMMDADISTVGLCFVSQ